MIGAQCAGPIVIGGVQANEPLVVGLPDRILRDQPFGMPDRRRKIAAFFVQHGQAAQHLLELLAVMLALGLQPLVVQSTDQVVLIETRGIVEGLQLLRSRRLASWRSLPE